MIIHSAAEISKINEPVAMVDGGFDPLHHGHVAYFKAASELGLPLLCCLSPDEWIIKKHPILLPQEKRAQVIDAIKYISYTYLSTISTANALKLIKPKKYIKGKDWENRLPEAEVGVCKEFNIEIVYLDTILDSSTKLINQFIKQ
jgi:glycerol-3-phosphate cytidylyltransferase-like family protein